MRIRFRTQYTVCNVNKALFCNTYGRDRVCRNCRYNDYFFFYLFLSFSLNYKHIIVFKMHMELICIFHFKFFIVVIHGNAFLLLSPFRVCTCVVSLQFSVIQRVHTVECKHCTTANNQNITTTYHIGHNELTSKYRNTHTNQVSSNLNVTAKIKCEKCITRTEIVSSSSLMW